MRVILELDESVLNKLKSKADAEKRSRKNYMEKVLENAANGNSPIMERLEPVIMETIKTQVGIQQQIAKTETPQQPLDKFSQICQNIQYADSRKEIEKYVSQATKELDWKKQALIKEYAEKMMEQKGFVYND